MNIKNNISTKRTYTLLKDQMYALLSESSFEKLTLTEICNASMVPRSTFYRYFEDKYDLLRYCLQSLTEDMHLTEDVICFKNMESIQEFLLILIRHIAEHREQYQKIYLTNKDGILMEIIKQDLKQILTEKILHAQKNGLKLKICLPIFAILLAEFYFSIVTCYLELENQISIEEFVENVCMFTDKDFFED
ncbi:MAG: TetR/AcrR family transcriptional regulator [Brotaphodocola sp.]